MYLETNKIMFFSRKRLVTGSIFSSFVYHLLVYSFNLYSQVSTVMRALGVYPTEKALVLEILPEMQDDEPTGFVSYRKFEKVMLKLLATKEWEPDSGDIILHAFRTIDTENKGYISADLMEDLLSRGTAFRPKELENFMMVAKDPDTGNIFYEDYVALLTKNIGK